jgi:hypothetical protein
LLVIRARVLSLLMRLMFPPVALGIRGFRRVDRGGDARGVPALPGRAGDLRPCGVAAGCPGGLEGVGAARKREVVVIAIER